MSGGREARSELEQPLEVEVMHMKALPAKIVSLSGAGKLWDCSVES
jgi:hypothetical protein